jgi:hypothetical protein
MVSESELRENYREYDYIHSSLALMPYLGYEEDRVVIRNEVEMTQAFVEAKVMQILDIPSARYLHIPALYDNKDVYLNKNQKSL